MSTGPPTANNATFGQCGAAAGGPGERLRERERERARARAFAKHKLAGRPVLRGAVVLRASISKAVQSAMAGILGKSETQSGRTGLCVGGGGGRWINF